MTREREATKHVPTIFRQQQRPTIFNWLKCNFRDLMPLEQTTLYRGLLRELRLSISTPRKVNRDIITHFRSLVESCRSEDRGKAKRNLEAAMLFLKSQREHKRLLERYNPLFELTAEERIKATARRKLNIFRQLMPSTQILKCDPSSINFYSSSDQPKITSLETMEALKIASHQLVDLAQTVVFPTETVYGLGALALDHQAASKIFSTKGRPPDNPLIVHVSSLTMLHSILPPDYVIPQVYQTLMKHFWPGPLTLLFPRNPAVIPSIITANQSTVAIRIPSHPVARALIAIANAPLAAPSANTSGKPSPTRASHVLKDLDGKLSLILDGGPCGVGLESTVVDGLHADGNLRVLRPGGITVEDIQRVLLQDMKDDEHFPKVLVHKRDYTDKAIESSPTTPGMKYRHYSPSVPVILLITRSDPHDNHRRLRFLEYVKSLRTDTRLKVGVLAPTDSVLWDHLLPVENLDWHRYPLGPVTNPSVIAYRLFDGLLTLEQQGVHLMFIEEVDEEREGLAIMNRVRKAAGESISVSFS